MFDDAIAVPRYFKAVLTRLRTIRSFVQRREPSPGLRILLYHRISEDRDPLALRPARFRAQMDYLAARGYEVLDIVRALALFGDDTPTAKVIACSFDDGYFDVIEHAVPVLERYGFSATIYISTAVADGDAVLPWYRRQPRMLEWTDIRRLDGGDTVWFEAHSLTHPDLTALSDEQCRTEIAECKLRLEDQLRREVTTFCYPGGLFGTREEYFVREAGYAYGVSCEPGVNGPKTNPYALRRIQIDRTDRLFDFRAKVRGSHDSPLLGRGLYRRLRYGTAHERSNR